MTLGRFKAGVFILEWLNALATALYLNYLFFFLKDQYGFSNMENLLFGALNGFIYIGGAWYAGQFAQRNGYMMALRVGFGLMAAVTAVQLLAISITDHVVLMVIWTIGVCFTWPSLEALAVEKEVPAKVPKLIGFYNFVWSSGAALAFFGGGAIAQKLGWQSIFWIPALIHVFQWIMMEFMAPSWNRLNQSIVIRREDHPHHPPHPQANLFLSLAWLANPFAYIAINCAIPLLPDLAARMGLTTAYAGFFCSIWFFSRMATFVFLAWWPGWHYRFGWLVASYAGVVLCFCAMLLSDQYWIVVAVQLLFGWCLGLIYYSSLYYSMDVSEEKGAHGGIHEAAIGVGIFGGPAIGALSLYMFPGRPAASVWGVALVLLVGFVGLGAIWKRR